MKGRPFPALSVVFVFVLWGGWLYCPALSNQVQVAPANVQFSTALLVLCQMICHVTSKQCGNEQSTLGMMLQRHIFKRIMGVPLGHECLQACNLDLRCQSFNYVISQEMCELNNRTKEACPEDFVVDSERYYFRRYKERVPLGSIPELPAVSCKEIKASEGGQAVSGKYWFDSIITGKNVLAYCDMESEECHGYKNLTDAYRKNTHGVTTAHCDQLLGPDWFRFQGAAGTQMPTSCVAENHCGTHSAGWLNGVHPTVAEGQVTRQVCFSWSGNCCLWAINIQVRDCGSYFVYYFNGTPASNPCSLSYCGSD